jgi:pimeloyl-ACP methyl ester carboxylesterase
MEDNRICYQHQKRSLQMNTSSQKFIKIIQKSAIFVLAVIIILALSGMVYQTAQTEVDQRKYPAPGVLVNVDGYKMHIHCLGEGQPPIILDHEGSGSSVDWAFIQPQSAKHTRVCAYDRAGFGWSEPNPAPRTLEQQVHELHELLQGANEKGPYILVGHSYGARVGRFYAARHPDEVAGMVLMDAGIMSNDPRYPAELHAQTEAANRMIRTARRLTPFGLVRLLYPVMGLPTYDLPEDARLASTSFIVSSQHFTSLIAQGDAMPTVLREEHQVTSLGNIPLLVLVSTEPGDAVREVWNQANIEMAGLSTNGSYRIVQGATHMSLVYRQADAQTCTDGILEVLDAVRSGQKLVQK